MAKGKLVWFDLMTTDVAKAKAFYGELVGWKTSIWKAGEYEMWAARDGQVGGVMALDDGMRKAKVPSHWMAYVAVEDVDASAKQAESLGGKVLVPGQDIPDVGRFAVIADPLGASIALFRPKSEQSTMPPAMSTTPGHFSWGELNTTDWKKAWAFYEQMFGWKRTRSMDLGQGMGEYAMFGLDNENSVGGMSNTATKMKAPPHWLYYIVVDDCDAAAKKVSARGGKVLNGPMDIPEGGRIAQCMDPQGAVFGIHSEQKQKNKPN